MNPVLRQILLSKPFSPSAFFKAGEIGVWFDPSDITTLFQDSAGTTPVTAVGQSVGLILDKSGNAKHASQTVAGSRPVWQQDSSGLYYLSFDGIGMSLLTASVDFSGTDKVTAVAGVSKASDAAVGMVVELGPSTATTAGGFFIAAPGSAGTANYGANARGSVVPTQINVTTYTAPTRNVVSFLAGLGVDSRIVRVDGIVKASDASDLGTGNLANQPIYIGRRNNATLPFSGGLYGLIVRGASTTVSDVSRSERWMAKKAGVTL